MYILVTDPERMLANLRRSFYVIPESESDIAIYQEHNLYVQEAEEREKANEKWGASVSREKAALILKRIWEAPETHCVDVLNLLKSQWQGSRFLAIALVSKVFRGVATKEDLKKFNERALARLNEARRRLKRIHNTGADIRWAKNIERGVAS